MATIEKLEQQIKDTESKLEKLRLRRDAEAYRLMQAEELIAKYWRKKPARKPLLPAIVIGRGP